MLESSRSAEHVRSLACALLLLNGCGGPQSTLQPAGRAAERIADLFWLMSAGAIVIWLGVVGLAAYATYVTPKPHGLKAARLLIVIGGVIFPTVLLVALLIHGLMLLPGLLAPAPKGSLKIQVVGEQWWWRVRYLPASGGKPVELANEVHLPVGAPVEFELESPDVIHSFWIPALGGKMDMIPGRTTRLTLEPIGTGVFRGVCAEYCGASHALMSFPVVVQEKREFERWLAEQAKPASSGSGAVEVRGQTAFLANGCGACHSVRGTQANGVIGPDLTHVGSRLSLAAGVLGNESRDFRRWLAHTHELKPGVRMPRFGMLAADDLGALAAFLESLK